MNVLMIGVDKKSVGGMLTVVENYTNDEEFIKKTHLTYIPTVTNSSKLVKVLFFIKALLKIIFIIIHKKIDIIHIHMAEKGSVFREGLVLVIGKTLGCKTIIHMHGATIEDWYIKQKSCVKKLIRKIFNSADRILVLGYVWKKFMDTLIEDESKTIVLYNAVKVPEHNHYNTKATHIIFLGLLLQRKGIDDLLKSVAQIKEKLPEYIKVKLYGSDLTGDIKEKIKKLQLDNVIEYCGWLTEDKKQECFSNTLINILPSYNEGLPMSILETMAYGIPNITTNIAAIPEAITNEKEGILINPGDINGLSDGILKIVYDSDIRKKYSQNSYSRAKTEFNLNIHIDKIYSIYLELLRNERCCFNNN